MTQWPLGDVVIDIWSIQIQNHLELMPADLIDGKSTGSGNGLATSTYLSQIYGARWRL